MRLTVEHLKLWIVTALVVPVILVAGGIYLTRTALRDQPLTEPSWAPGSSLAAPTSTDAPTSRSGASPPSTSHSRSGSSSSSARTPPTSAATTTPVRTSPPPPAGVPQVLVAGPTIDNVYPDDSGCHVFWMPTPDLRATVVGMRFKAGSTPTTSPPPSGGIPPLRVDYVACDRKGPGAPLPEAGCDKRMVISTEHSCGVRFSVDKPTVFGLYTGVLSFDLSVLCTGAEVIPCTEIDSPYRPSADRPVHAVWSTDCQIEFYAKDHPVAGPPKFPCGLGPA